MNNPYLQSQQQQNMQEYYDNLDKQDMAALGGDGGEAINSAIQQALFHSRPQTLYSYLSTKNMYVPQFDNTQKGMMPTSGLGSMMAVHANDVVPT